MNKRTRSVLIGSAAALALLTTAGVALAASNGITVAPFSYNAVGLTGLYGGEFTPNFGPSAFGKWERVGGDWQLHLEKSADLYEVASAGAQINGVAGLTLTSLGFTIDNDGEGYCGAGAPRFNVRLDDGTLFFFGCTYGTHTTVTDGTEIVFTNADAFPSGWPGFGVAVVDSISIVFDEPGSVNLDNIMVNGMTVGGPNENRK